MKSGIDYFPLDVTLDDKWELIEAEFGLTGFAVIVKLLQKIYSSEGYYCDWTNEVALLFSKRIGLGGGAVSEIVEASVRRGIFSDHLFQKYHVLTSVGIQKRYLEAVGRRKEVSVKREYLLLKCDQIPCNVVISGENVSKNEENVDISKQSKVKESKEKKSTLRETMSDFNFPPALAGKIEDWLQYKEEKRQSYKETGLVQLLKKLKTYSEKYGEQAVIKAIEESMVNNYSGIVWEWIEKAKKTGGKYQWL